MRKLIVSNFVTLDGYYETKDKTIDDFFRYVHEDYRGITALIITIPNDSAQPIP